MSSAVQAEAGALQPPTREQRSRMSGRVWGLLRGSPSAMIGAPLVLIFTLTGLAGIVLLHVGSLQHLWTDQDLFSVLKPPGTNGHLLGTDELGRDLFWRVVAGTGLSFELGLAVTAATLLIGGTVGIVAGYFGGVVDRIVGAVIDVTWGFPLILLAVMLAGVLNPGFTTILISVAALNWAGFAPHHSRLRPLTASTGIRRSSTCARNPDVADPSFILSQMSWRRSSSWALTTSV